MTNLTVRGQEPFGCSLVDRDLFLSFFPLLAVFCPTVTNALVLFTVILTLGLIILTIKDLITIQSGHAAWLIILPLVVLSVVGVCTFPPLFEIVIAWYGLVLVVVFFSVFVVEAIHRKW